jgi:hypothetical protein
LSKVSGEPYSLALTAYALTLAKSSQADAAWTAFVKHMKTKEDGSQYWAANATDPTEDTPSYYYNSPRPVDVEMTGYALLTRVLRDEIAEAVPIVRWLTSQRNAQGGWSSTQVTMLFHSLYSYNNNIAGHSCCTTSIGGICRESIFTIIRCNYRYGKWR